MIVWEEKKRRANLEKHHLDFADAELVFRNPEKITIPSQRRGENRQLELAMVREMGMILALIYVRRDDDVRVISFRIASRRERRFYEKECQESD